MRLGKLSEPLGIKCCYNPINPVLMSHVSSLQALVFGVNITVAISGHLCISCACSLDVAAVCADSTKKSERGLCRQHLGKRSLTNSVSMIGDSLHLTAVKLYCQR
jgi:hypothetical protein